jgi:hypothetical protein
VGTAMSFPIRDNYNKHVYMYNHFPAQYVHQTMPLHIRQNRANYVRGGNIYINKMKLHNAEQDKSRDNECKYLNVFDKINYVKIKTFIHLYHGYLDKTNLF